MLQFAPASSDEGLPALVERARATLASARDAAEVLEAKTAAAAVADAAGRAARLAKAVNAHAEVIGAAHRMKADALAIEHRATVRIADEYDAAQERGEVSVRGQHGAHLPDGNMRGTLADIGLSFKAIHEARKVRDAEAADPGIVARTLDAAVERGDEPTRAMVKKAVSGPSDYLNARAAEDEAKSNDALDQRDLRALRKLWKSSRPGARALFREFIKGEK